MDPVDLLQAPAVGRADSGAAASPPAPPAILDAGWLFLVAGIAVLGATVLIPAADDLAQAEHLRDRARLIEKNRDDRLGRYDTYLGALDRRDPSLVLALAQSQLNEIPADRQPILATAVSPRSSASVFPALEPAPVALPERHPVNSLLQRWATRNDSRLWLIAGGAACILVGLLPKARR